MHDKYLKKGLKLANNLGHKKVYTEADFAAYLPKSDGCSGYLSAVYEKLGEKISCERCCNMHDWLYSLGGNWLARLRADLLLARCSASAGKFPDGIKGWPRRVVRCIRAWLIIFMAVRRFGALFWGKP